MRFSRPRGLSYPFLVVFISLLMKPACAQDSAQSYTFGIVPQQSASKTARHWVPILNHVSKISGHKLVFKTARNIPAFEQQLDSARYDFAYMNPYHYIYYHPRANYNAISMASNKRLRGIIVVRKDSPYQSLESLHQQELAFPSPNAFAATMLIRSELKSRGIHITPRYVASHDSVYRNVNQKRFVAGGGVMRTLQNMEAAIKDNLHVLYQTEDYTSHAIAAHQRVPEAHVRQIQKALVTLGKTSEGKQLLNNMRIEALEAATDANWNDIRTLNLDL